MKKNTKTLLLSLAAFFLLIGFMSYQHSTTYAELTDIQTIKGTIFKLHCPEKGTAALSFENSELTYNLTMKFRANYCNNNDSQTLLGKNVTMKAVQVNGDFYQVYKIEENDQVILSHSEVESDQSSSTFGLFFLAFLLIALVIYKSRKPLSSN